MKILIAVDGSPPAVRAVAFAVSLVERLPSASRSLTLIGVHDDVGLRHAEHFVGHAAVRDYLHDLTQKDLESARAILDSAGVEYTVENRIGTVATEIVAVATTGRFDLIVLGSKGRSGLSDLLLGSVAQRVLTVATQPVLLVK